MSKVKIPHDDKNRVVLTDTLPYETPITFSNEGLYNYLNKNETNAFASYFINKNIINTRPYNFKIKKGYNSKRTLSVPHPSTQLMFIDLYSEFSDLIIDLCSRSVFSIRFPAKVASAFYEKQLLSDPTTPERSVEKDEGLKTSHQQFSSSYFAYQKYNFIHKFYDSYEFHRLEKKFCQHPKLDISNCFPSIYTHTIAWAVVNLPKLVPSKSRGFLG